MFIEERVFRFIKNFVFRILILIILIEILPSFVNRENPIIKTKKASAYATQTDSLAPGYIIRYDNGGITFDLSDRLFDTMSVQSFKFRNADPNKRGNDKKEEMLNGDNAVWISKDNLENGQIYEIEAEIYDSETNKTVKHINYFKFNDKNMVFNPQIEFSGSLLDRYYGFLNKDFVLNLQSCKYLVDNSKKMEIEILNSDLSSTTIEKLEISSQKLKEANYIITFQEDARGFQINKDYLVRIKFDDEVWETLVSGVLKNSPKIHSIYQPTELRISNTYIDFFTFNPQSSVLELSTEYLKWGYKGGYGNKKIKIILTSDKVGLPLKESEKIIEHDLFSHKFDIPGEYFGNNEPANFRILYLDPLGNKVYSDVTFQLVFVDKDKKNIKFWNGMRLTNNQELSDGYKINKIGLINNNQNQIPHSWDSFPRVHYITLFDETRKNQIGGEFRFDVIKNKNEFVGYDSIKEHDVSGCDFKIKYENMKQGFNTFYFKVESSSQYKEWAYGYVPILLYADIVDIKSLNLSIKNVTPSKNGYNFSILAENFKPQIGEKMTIIDDEGKEHFSNGSNGKEFNFNNVPLINNGKYIVTYNKISSLVYFNSLDSSILFNPVIVGTNVDSQEGLDINMNGNLSKLINSNNSMNKIRILHMNGNTTGNEFQNITTGSNKVKLSKNLSVGTQYIAEFSNGSEKFRTTFEYTPLRLNLGSATGTTAKLEWSYPNNYLIMEGDILNIYFKKDGFSYPAVPDAKIVHGFQNIDFDKVRTYTMKNLSPNINYTAKLELVTTQGVKFISEVEFVTSNFKILNENIVGLSEDGILSSKKLDIVWDINQADIEFSKGDKVDVFLKLQSHDTFSKTPIYTITEDINRVNKATIDVPNYNESYSVKIVYTIGGVKHSSKVLNFKVELGKLSLKMLDITDSTARVEWSYPENIIFNNGQEIKIEMKKSNEVNYRNLVTIRHHDSKNNLAEITSFELWDLQSDTIYLAKIQYKVGEKVTAGIKEEIIQESEIEFTTSKFDINNFSVDKIDGKKVRLNWEVSNSNYSYTNGDKVDIYMKEKSNSDYSLVSSTNQNLTAFKNLEITIPKYNTDYDIKVVYILKGKEISGYTTYSLNIGEINLTINSITDNEITLSWEYPSDYKFENGDKVEILYKKESESWKSNQVKVHGTEDLGLFKSLTINDLEKDKKYELQFKFTPVGSNSIKKNYIFKATSGFQISGIKLDNINSTSMLLMWSTYNQNRNFSSSDKIEIFVKEKKKSRNNEFSDTNKILTKNGSDLKGFSSYKVENLAIGKDYIFRVKYTISENDGSKSGIKEIYEDIEGRPEFGKFDSYVIDKGATNVKLEVVYPEGYEKLQGDILDIFIKKQNDTNYKQNPNFTAVHGKDDVDLNEILLLDILGLAPNTKYNAKIVFWSGGGGKGTKSEKEVSFETLTIGGIGDVVVVDVMDYVIKIGIQMNPEDLLLGETDYCKVYIKKKSESKYPTEPNGDVSGNVFNNDRVVTAYFEELNTDYDIKVIVSMGGSIYEKVIDFTSKVDDLNIEVKEINPMTAQVEWKYPENYTLVDGESVEIYVKYKTNDDFEDEPDLKLVQSDELTLSDINLVELSSLVPDTQYDLKVKLNLLEADLPEVVEEFKTSTFSIQNLKIRGISDDGVSISWEIDTDEINFIDEYDDLSIFVKNSDDEYDFDNPVTQFKEGLNELRTASFSIDPEIEDPKIMLSYLIEDFEAYSEIGFNPLDIEVEKDESGISINWGYPEGIEFLDGDKISIYLKDVSDSAYPKDPIFTFVHGEDGDLLENNSIYLEELESGSYLLKFLLITQNVTYSPIEIEIDLDDGELDDAIKLDIKSNSNGRSLLLGSDEKLNINFNEEVSIKPDGLGVEKVNNFPNLLRVTNLVPEKFYKRILINGFTSDGSEKSLFIDNIKIRAESKLEQFLVNIYKFAFERLPDESGYGFWLSKLIEKKEITGKYVVYNLMFAEKEFTERNLPDEELIKVLYQIVVNREYDEGGLQYWVKEYNQTYLPQANNDSFEAQKTIVLRMLHEQEFKNLCESMDILW